MTHPSSILAFNDPWHDSSFCFFGADEVVHCEAERFTRRKYDTISPLLVFCDLYPERVEDFRVIAVEEGGSRLGALIRNTLACRNAGELPSDLAGFLGDSLGPQTGALLQAPQFRDTLTRFLRHLLRSEVDVYFCGHHAAHAANAFFSSGFEDALTVTVDGIATDYALGSGSRTLASRGEVAPTYDANGSVSECHGRTCVPIYHMRDISLGLAWTRITRFVLRYGEGEEGTVMATAALGDSKRFRRDLEQMEPWTPVSDWAVDQDPAAKEAMARYLATLRESIRGEQDAFDLAASLQWVTEQKLRAFLARFVGPQHRRLCLSGGAILNCQMVGRIREWFPQLHDVYVPPAPYDGGISIGLAQLLHHQEFGRESPWSGARAPFAMGRRYSRTEVIGACRSAGVDVRPIELGELFARLDRGQVVALFGGAAESGRRALGHRSIIADPRKADMKRKLNETIKHRQWFRPFAPMVLAEQAGEWFDCPAGFASPYMSFAVPARSERREQVPAIVHLDGTARVQTVHADLTPDLHGLLSGWHAFSGVPVLLNTSFNDREPIVQSPADALNTLRRAGLDALYFTDFGLLATCEAAA
jgi:carbamoyltransferase